MCADVVVQPLPPDRHPEFTATISAAFGNHPDPRKGELMESIQPDDRRLGALDGDRVVGTAASFAFDMTVPGGATVPVAGVTAVGVLATHRRRGVLRQLMAAQLDDVVRRGEAIAILTASESGIYRRFGYGIGSFIRSTELDSDRIGFADRRGDELELVLLRGDEARPLIAPIYDRWRRARPGAVAFTPAWWDVTLGPIPNYIGGGDQFVVVCEPQHGRGGGFARYTAGPPGGSMTLDVASVIAEDPVVESRLWRYLTEVDLSNRVRVEQVPVDCPLRWQVTDPRQVRTTLDRDWLHVRILDVPAALSARRYAADGELTMAVTDAFRPGPATGGRFRLTVRDGEGRCEPAAGEPELTLDVAALGSAYLGGVRLTDLAAAGIVAEHVPGALARADALVVWPVAPFCPTHF